MTQTTQPVTSPARSTEAVVRRWTEDLWNGRLELIEDLFAPHMVDHNPLPGQAPGGDGQRQVIELFRSAFPDLSVTAHDVVVAGRTAAVRWSASGTHRGEMLGVAPAGRHVTMHGIDIVRVDGDRIIERWGEFDALGLLAQLGAVPGAT